MTRVYIDVGANYGTEVDRVISQQPDSDFKIYAIEPHPHLAHYLREKYKNLRQVVVEEVAITNREVADCPLANTPSRQETFYISNHPGCHSLKPIVGLGGSDEFWAKGYGPITMTGDISVTAVRLDDFFDYHNIEIVEHLKSDTQGSDLDVLKSLGPEKIRQVRSVQVECWVTPRTEDFYEDEGKCKEVSEYVISYGFKPLLAWRWHPNFEKEASDEERQGAAEIILVNETLGTTYEAFQRDDGWDYEKNPWRPWKQEA
jgi:FkbM family methyltransferase